ncbi:LytR C-terminal domain-containing protein [Corynebacterium sp. UBA2622]|uniref:LytR C-terminal domain-containing protein n=1 Tax=Corynebacterium sp. UBA2622 TaxID=1946393 RepID=UPI0025C4035F|nr:LytR C-terminal domain-containing protein [Corynebacterium sp. UBA2622]
MTNVNPGNEGRRFRRGPKRDHYADYDDIDDTPYNDADFTEFADPDAEHVEYADAEYEEYPEQGYNEEGYRDDGYRGAHRVRPEEPAEGAVDEDGAAPLAAGGSTAAAAGGLPKRGLGMILIAVGAILLLWGLYALTQRDAETQNAVATPSASQSAPANGQSAPQPAQPGQAAPSGQASPSGQSAPNGQPSPSGQPGEPGQPAAPAPAQPGQAGQLTRENAEVSVYNNSPTPDLAGTTAQKLAGDFKVKNKSADAAQMNLPEQTYGIFPQTFVFYDPSVAGAEQVAADVAQRVGGAPRSVRDLPQGASLPREVVGNGNAVTVVLAG